MGVGEYAGMEVLAASIAAVAMVALPPASAGTWSYAGEVSAGYDSNLGNAGDDHDARDSVVASAGVSISWEQRFGLFNAVQVRASAAVDQLADIADLSNERGALRIRFLHKPGRGFYTPVVAASLAAGLRNYGSAIRDGHDARATVSLAAPLTTAVQWRIEATRVRRSADGRSFDLDTGSYALDLDWRMTPRMTAYGGLRRDRGDFTISAPGEGEVAPKQGNGELRPAREHRYLEPVADAIEADSAFGDDWWAFRVEGSAWIGSLGLNLALTPDLSLDLQSLRAETTIGELSYKRWIGSLGLLYRW